jgi:tRNA pseudouridine55 synthase
VRERIRSGLGSESGIPAPLGVLNIHKESGLSSHDVVARVRRITNTRRVGHAGTLDPMATGVLVVCVGQATRIAEYLVGGSKEYRATIRFGATTTTWDADGQVLIERDHQGLVLADILPLLSRFVGEVEQVPPMYSAIKHAGQPLYRLARQGISVERAARRVVIERIDVVEWQPPDLVVDITCSAGTYVRALAHELGEVSGVGAHLAALIRVAVGPFRVDDAVRLDELANDPFWPTGKGRPRHLISLRQALGHLPSLIVDAEAAARLRQGQAVALPDGPPVGDKTTDDEHQPRFAFDGEGELVAVVRSLRGEESVLLWQPVKVLAPANRPTDRRPPDEADASDCTP